MNRQKFLAVKISWSIVGTTFVIIFKFWHSPATKNLNKNFSQMPWHEMGHKFSHMQHACINYCCNAHVFATSDVSHDKTHTQSQIHTPLLDSNVLVISSGRSAPFAQLTAETNKCSHKQNIQSRILSLKY